MESPDSNPMHIDLASIVRQSWGIFAQRPHVHLLAFLVVILGGMLTLGLAMAPLLAGYIRMVDRAAHGEPVGVGDVLDGLSTFVPAFLTGLVTVAGVAAGSALIVLPGLALAVIWAYGLWFVALEQSGVLAALGGSYRLARANVGSLLLILLVVVALNVAGSLVVVGVLASAPLSIILMTLGFAELCRA
jgi:hypothetical protein